MYNYVTIVVNCGPLTDPDNGRVNTSGTTFGSKATYSCSNGYTLNVNNTRICGSEGVWSNLQPSCNSTCIFLCYIICFLLPHMHVLYSH